jgi:hypothetical protein
MELEWDGKDQLDRSCEKLRSITYSQGGKEFLASCTIKQNAR